MILLALLLAATPLRSAKAPEKFPFPATLKARYEHAFDLAQAGKVADALADSQAIAAAAPSNPRGYRLLGLIQLALEHPEQAEPNLRKALALGLDEERAVDVHAGLAQIALNRHQDTEAERQAQLAMKPGVDPRALLVLFNVAMRRKQYTEGERLASQLIAVDPGVGVAHACRAWALANLDRLEEAKAEADLARAGGIQEPQLFSVIDEGAFTARWERRAWQWPLWIVGLLAMALGLLYAAGSMLSRLTVRGLLEARGALERGEQPRGERFAGRVYDGVLGFGVLVFYLSIPAMLALTVGVGGGLLYVMLVYSPVISFKLALIAGVVAIGGVGAILRGLLVGGGPSEDWPVLERAQAPALFAAIDEVAELAQSRTVDQVVLEAGTGIGVHESGRPLAVLLGGGRRVLHLGLFALRGLTVSELKSILAHEFGHFSHGETRVSPMVGRMKLSLVTILGGLARGGGGAANPVFWYLRLYARVFFAVSAGHSRRRELLADRTAALAFGGETFARALTQVIANGAFFDRFGGRVAAGILSFGIPLTNLYGDLDAVQSALPPGLLDEAIEAELNAAPGEYDSHPPSAVRIERVAGIPAPAQLDGSPALALIPEGARFESELTREIAFKVAGRISAAAIAKRGRGDEARLSVALALVHEGILRRRATDGRATALLTDGLARLAGELGEHDASLVQPLLVLAEVQGQAHDRAGAERSLLQALSIAKARTPADQGELDAIQQRLTQVRAAA